MPSYTVRLRIGHAYLDLDEIQAQTPHMACEIVARMHRRFEEWISAVGLDDAEPPQDLTPVEGRCCACRKWLLKGDKRFGVAGRPKCSQCARTSDGPATGWPGRKERKTKARAGFHRGKKRA